MFPFAFDLISTLVIGSTLPVATTDFEIVPRSTVASRDASSSGDAPLSVARPAAPPTTSSATPAPMYRRFRDFLAPSMQHSDESRRREVQQRSSASGFSAVAEP